MAQGAKHGWEECVGEEVSRIFIKSGNSANPKAWESLSEKLKEEHADPKKVREFLRDLEAGAKRLEALRRVLETYPSFYWGWEFERSFRPRDANPVRARRGDRSWQGYARGELLPLLERWGGGVAWLRAKGLIIEKLLEDNVHPDRVERLVKEIKARGKELEGLIGVLRVHVDSLGEARAGDDGGARIKKGARTGNGKKFATTRKTESTDSKAI